MARVNYLNNRDIMSEIHKSKSSYSYFTTDEHAMYNAIVYSLDEIDSDFIKNTKIEKADKLVKEKKHRLKQEGIKEKVEPIDPETLLVEDLVFRLITWDHIPICETKQATAQEREKNGKKRSLGDDRVKINFVPFKHYVLDSFSLDDFGEYGDLTFKEVGRSHWIDSLGNGEFCLDHGTMTKKLSLMFLRLVNKYATRSNWRGYSYIDDMKGQALMQLSQVGLQFNEARSSNPFSYYTETINNSFTRVLNSEKKSQNIRDSLLIHHGSTPSFSHQLDHEMKKLIEEITNTKKEKDKEEAIEKAREAEAEAAAEAATQTGT